MPSEHTPQIALQAAYASKAVRRELKQEIEAAGYRPGLRMVGELVAREPAPAAIASLAVGPLLTYVHMMGPEMASHLLVRASTPYMRPLGKLRPEERLRTVKEIGRWVRNGGSTLSNYRPRPPKIR